MLTITIDYNYGNNDCDSKMETLQTIVCTVSRKPTMRDCYKISTSVKKNPEFVSLISNTKI